MKGSKVLIVGCGDIGIPLAEQLHAAGAGVWGLRRQPGLLPAYIHPIAADVTDAASLSVLADHAFDYVVTTLTPAGISERGYRSIFVDGVCNLLQALQPQQSIQRLYHVSSTSVYHQSDGEWVDETSATEPTSFSGKSLLQAERLWAESGINTTVIRFAGIYGPGRRRLIDQVLAGKGGQPQPVLFTNRIHRDDCVGVLRHLLAREQAGQSCESVYLGVDNEPAPMWEVKQWLAAQLQVELQSTAEVATRRNSKRCSNQRLLQSGYTLLYPDYREGYLSVLAQQ